LLTGLGKRHIVLITLKSFAEVPFINDEVDTQPFLEASDGLVQMFGTLVSLPLKPRS